MEGEVRGGWRERGCEVGRKRENEEGVGERERRRYRMRGQRR